jgi:hypothetical protein
MLHNDKVCDLYNSLSVVLYNKMHDTSLGMLPGLGDNKGMQNFGKKATFTTMKMTQLRWRMEYRHMRCDQKFQDWPQDDNVGS